MKNSLREFIDFVKEQGIVGLSIGLVLGTAVKNLVDELVKGFIDPAIGMLVGNREGLEKASYTLVIGNRSGEFMWGKFLSTTIQFIAVAAFVYLAVRLLKVDRDTVKEMSKESAKG
jgi:large-conductance mechanosensitive channel